MSAERPPFHEWMRLEQPRLGTRVTYANDEFFAAKERLIDPAEPVFVPDRYDDHGKWMDGWESRRRRTPGHDHCIVRLGLPGVIHGVNIDTRHFTGNFPPEASLDACVADTDVPDGEWTEILGRTALRGDSQHFFDIGSDAVWSHLRFNIYPDGGVARLRVFGEVRPGKVQGGASVDLAALQNGGRALACSDEHFGSMHNLLVPGPGLNMGDGWETARRRGPGNDWVVVALGHRGTVERIVVDTAYFKGNYPDRVAIDAGDFSGHAAALAASAEWQALLPESKLEADREHAFVSELRSPGAATHLRMSIFPDGGVSRLRVYGKVSP